MFLVVIQLVALQEALVKRGTKKGPCSKYKGLSREQLHPIKGSTNYGTHIKIMRT